MNINTNAISKPDFSVEQTVNDVLEWDDLCGNIARIFKLTNEEANKLYESRPARLIASIPYAAGCQEAERTAFGHLCLYVAEIRSGYGSGDHNADDTRSIYSRLRMIMNFSGGDSRIIDHGMAILALVMINGYYRSRDSDSESGICNPFNDGSWDFKTLSEKLVKDIALYPCDALDEILPTFYATYATW